MPVQKIKFHVAQKKFHLGLLPQAKSYEEIFTPGDLEAIWKWRLESGAAFQ